MFNKLKLLFTSTHSDNAEYFEELKPGERIRKVIEVFILPELETFGFKMSKSSLTLTRNLGDFEQEIYFPKNKWNNGNQIVSFDIIFSVKSIKYKSWHQKKYGYKTTLSSVYWKRAYEIPDWSKEFFENWNYDLANTDNKKLITILKDNIINKAIPQLNSVSNYRGAIEYPLKENSFYYKAPMLIDFALILDDLKLANQILNWYLEFVKTSNAKFIEELKNEIENRKNIIS